MISSIKIIFEIVCECFDLLVNGEGIEQDYYDGYFK